MKKIIIIIITLLFCTSCYNYQEVNEIAIVNGMGIDYLNNEYKITLEIVDINSDKEQSYTLEDNGSSLDEALENIKNISSKDISLSHLETVVINEYLINNKIIDIAKYFITTNEITTNFYLVVATSANKILNNKNDINSINTKNISDVLDDKNNKNYQFDYIISSILDDKSIKIPFVSLEDNNIKIDKEGYTYEK